MRFSLHFHEFLTILSLPIFFSKISADISPIYPKIFDISDISVKSKYRYIRDYRYFHPWYVRGTRDHGIFYSYLNNFTLVGYTNSNLRGDVETKKSIVGYAFLSWNRNILMVIKEMTSCNIIKYRS